MTVDGATGGRWAPSRWLGPLAIGVAFVGLARWSWGKWPDVLIDFGNQLYVPWQLAEGKVLYADIAYKEGPLSMYVLALLFRLFGVSLRTLVWANLTLLAALCALVYGLFARACDRFTATLVCLVFLGVFAFSQYVGTANYNFVCPYTHEQTHGILLAVAMLVALERSLAGRRAGWCALAGACLGLVALTKIELFVPTTAVAALGLALLVATAPVRRARSVAAFVGAALAPPALALVLLRAQMPAPQALDALLQNWRFLDESVFSNRFYQLGFGFDDTTGNFLSSVRGFLGIVAVAGVAGAASWLLPPGRWGRVGALPAGLGLLAALVWLADAVPWQTAVRALPWTSAAACVGLAVACRRGGEADDRTRAAPLLSLWLWSVLAVLLLAKMVLNARVSHYGFTLAMPATLLLVAGLVWGIPGWLGARGRDGTLARALLTACVLAGVVQHLRWSNDIYAEKTFAVGLGADAFLTLGPRFDPRGHDMAIAAEHLHALMPVGATLLVLPEGTMLNYWLRRTNATRHTAFTPPALEFFGGEERILADLGKHPPDYIALVHRDTAEWGFDYFGTDPGYGWLIMEWVRQAYEAIERIGAEPFREDRFGIALMRRRTPGAGATTPLGEAGAIEAPGSAASAPRPRRPGAGGARGRRRRRATRGARRGARCRPRRRPARG